MIQFIAICIIVSWANPVICYLVKNNDMVTYCTILNHFTFILFFYQKSWVDYIHCKAIMQLNAFFFLKLFTLAPYNSKQAHSPMCMSEYMYPTLTLVFRSGELSGFDLKKINQNHVFFWLQLFYIQVHKIVNETNVNLIKTEAINMDNIIQSFGNVNFYGFTTNAQYFPSLYVFLWSEICIK